MDTRERQIFAIAGIIAGWPEDWDKAREANEINRTTGWTVETNAAQGHIVRHEGVMLHVYELLRALDIAADTARAPEGE